MTDPVTLSDRLAKSRGDPIQYEGKTVHGIYRDEVHPGDMLLVRFVRSARGVREGLSMSLKKGSFNVNRQRLRNLILWYDTAPDPVEIVCEPPRSGATLHVWNSWDQDGILQAWRGNAGMLVERGQGVVTLRCSDGVGGPDFEDLVVELRIVRRQTY